MIKKSFCFVFAVVLIGSKLVFGFSGGPPAERTGNPGEICGDDTCASSCHTSFAVNAGSAKFSISLPSSEYKPGQTLDITIEFTNTSTAIHGFEITAVDASGNKVGTFATKNDTAQTESYDNLYASHTKVGTGENSWTIQWTAPTASVFGPITFYAAGNEANGNSASSGDYIYTSTATISLAEEGSLSFKTKFYDNQYITNNKVLPFTSQWTSETKDDISIVKDYVNTDTTTTPFANECVPSKLRVKPKRISMKRGESVGVTVTVKGKNNKQCADYVVYAFSQRKKVGVEESMVTDENGKATFTIKAGDQEGEDVINFRIQYNKTVLKKKIRVKIKGVSSQVAFTDVTSSANVGNNSRGLGAAWGDYNNDGFLDLYISNYNDVNVLYKNNKDGTFSNVANSAGVNDDSTGIDIAWGDYNNDGFLDLYLVNDVGAGYGARNLLYRNNGDDTFTNVADDAGVSSRGYGLCAAWADYDNDGFLDLYVTNNAHTIFCYGQSNKLYKNKGDGTFDDVTETAGVGEKGNSMGVAWCDYDNDGDQDFCVLNFASPFLDDPEGNPSVLYQNNNGIFADVASSSGIEHTDGGHGVAWGDYDNDGDMDLYITNNSAILSTSPPRSSLGKNVLYRNNNDGTFTDVTDEAGVGSTLTSTEVTWVDYDNDGDLDLHVVNGGIQGNQSSILYENNGDGTFSDIASTAGIQNTGPGEGATWGDYDNDGDMDIYVVNYNQSNKLYKNNGNSNHWVIIKPVGTTSNRAGIGARIEVTTGTSTQIREVDGGSGFCSQDSLWVHFGLGSNEKIDTLKIKWPGGKVQTLPDVNTDQILAITEE